MNKLTVITEINEMLDEYCEGCFVKQQLAKEHGKAKAHQFCIEGCTIGEHLRFLGNEMNKYTE